MFHRKKNNHFDYLCQTVTDFHFSLADLVQKFAMKFVNVTTAPKYDHVFLGHASTLQKSLNPFVLPTLCAV